MKVRVALASALLAAPVQAGVTLDAQTREVSFDSLRTRIEAICITPQQCSVISQQDTPDSGSAAAPAFDPFSAALSSSIFPSVSVVQSSTISPSRMQAHASHAAAGAVSLGTLPGFPPITVSTTEAHETRSLYRVEFTLDEPTGYLLDGTIVGSGAGFVGDLDMQIALRHANGEVVHRIALEDDDNCMDDPPDCDDLGPLSLYESGTLAPGSYVLEAEIHGQTGTLVSFIFQFANSHTGSFDVDLQLGETVPIPPFTAPLAGLGIAAVAWRLQGGRRIVGRRAARRSRAEAGSASD